MNIYQERQTSGNVWPLSTLAANYPPQTEPELSVPNRQTGILDNLEGQMSRLSARGNHPGNFAVSSFCTMKNLFWNF